MKKFFTFTIISSFLFSCNTKPQHDFPVQMRYWTPKEYDYVISEVKYAYEEDEKPPSLTHDPNVFLKLADHQNFKVVLEDNTLGLNHRREVSEEFWIKFNELASIYSITDRTDKYVYDKERAMIEMLFLDYQLSHFRIGQEMVLQSSDDANEFYTKKTLESNYDAIVNNFKIVLDELKNKNAYSHEGQIIIADGIEKYFSQLIRQFPDANFSPLLAKCKAVKNKIDSPEIISSIEKIIELLEKKEA